MGKNKQSLALSFVILIFSFAYFFYFVTNIRSENFRRFDAKQFKKLYENSQWMVPNSKTPISDETLYTYAGYQLVRGVNPILINPETPYLGKYLIGLSILIFGNQNIIILITAFISLVLIFILSYQASSSTLVGSVAVLLTVFSTSFKEHLIHSPQLDIFQLMSLLAFLIYYSKYQRTFKKRDLIISGIFFGAFISFKFFLVNWVIFNLVLLVYYLIRKVKLKDAIIQLSVFNLIGISIYTLSYLRFFMLGGSLKGFLGTQKWIALFYANSKIDMTKLYGNYLNLIFFNKWRFWFNGYPVYPYKYWNLTWPIIYVLGFVSAVKLFRNKKRNNDVSYLIISFLTIYNIFLFITPIYPRYLLLLFIPLNILTAIYFVK